MKVSVITVIFNNEKTISDCIESVLSQIYQNIEHIIIDGKSTDKTLEIINSYGNKIAKVISEKDNGIYDAMNKGISIATGDIIGILNSDDIYDSENSIARIVDEFVKTKCDAVFGDLRYVDQSDVNRTVRFWKGSSYYEGAFSRGWHPAHLTFFAKKELYQKYSSFNTKFRISADFDLMLRFIEKYKIKTSYIPEVIGRMRVGGASNASIKNIIDGNRDIRKAFENNGLRCPYFYTLRRLFLKVLQYRW